MKVIFLLSALTFFLSLAYLTHPGKGDETPQSVEKQDIFFKDFTSGTTITGSWTKEGYMVKMEINSIRLNVKLVLEFTENGSADVNISPNGNRTPKHGKIHKFKECSKYPRNATCQDFEKVGPRSPGLIERAWNFSWTMVTGAQNKCYGITVAMAAGVWNGMTWLAERIWDKVTSLADGIWNGVSLLADRVWNGVTWLATRVWNGARWLTDGIWNGVTILAEWIWNGVTWLTEWTLNRVVWLAELTWNGVAWLAKSIWSGLTWIGRLFLLAGNYVTDGVVKFYYGYLHKTPESVEKMDFFFKDFTYGTIITGSWTKEGYMVKMEINSIRLNVKLVLEFTENGSADINSSPNANKTPKHGKIHKFKECSKYPRNATCQDFEKVGHRSPGLIERAWNFSWTMVTGAQNKCYGITVAMAAGVWNGMTWLAERIWDKVTSLADSIWNGVSLLADRVWNGVTRLATRVWNGARWLTDGIWNGVTILAEWTWNGVAWLTGWTLNRVAWLAELTWNGIAWLAELTWNGVAWLSERTWNGVAWLSERTWNGIAWLAEWIWNGVAWLSERTWNGVAWLAELTWNGVAWLAKSIWIVLTWIGRLFLPAGNYVTDGVVKFYCGYLGNHVNHIGARITASTWQDVFSIMSAVFVVNFALLVIYLLVPCTVNFIRRLWQARQDRIAAANLPPAPKKPIWRPKPKKKRRKNKNGW